MKKNHENNIIYQKNFIRKKNEKLRKKYLKIKNKWKRILKKKSFLIDFLVQNFDSEKNIKETKWIIILLILKIFKTLFFTKSLKKYQNIFYQLSKSLFFCQDLNILNSI